jgi:hypothetical protein
MSDSVDIRRVVVSGLAAGGAFLATTWADSKLSSHPFNDLKLIGQMFTTKTPLWKVLGTAGHFGFSIVVALLYARYFYKRLPGPPWLRGITFLQIENTLLYPVGPIVDRIHAGMRAGDLPPMLNWKTFKGQVLRHVAFGAVLGATYRDED